VSESEKEFNNQDDQIHTTGTVSSKSGVGVGKAAIEAACHQSITAPQAQRVIQDYALISELNSRH